MKIIVSCLIFALAFIVASSATPYQIPIIKGVEDFPGKVYIDPTGSHGDGSIESPYNTIQGLIVQPNTAYLIKSGTTLNERLDKVWSNNYVGTYGGDIRATLNGVVIIRAGSNGLVVNFLRSVSS